jgi:hypothetical protein
MLDVADCIAHRIRFSVPQPTKRQHIGNQIKAAFIFARADFVSVRGTHHILSISFDSLSPITCWRDVARKQG